MSSERGDQAAALGEAGGMARGSASRRTVVAAVTVALLLSGCDLLRTTVPPAQLEQRTRELLAQLPVDPLNDDVAVSVVEVKTDRPYVASHAVGQGIDTDALAAALLAQLEAAGFDILVSGPADDSLGFEVLASDGSLVLRAQLGPGGEDLHGYPPLEDGTYLAMQLANRGTSPAWTDVSR